MMRSPGLPIVVLALLVATPAPAHAAGEIYTLAGTGTEGPVREGGPAIAAGLGSDAEIAPLGAGGFLVADARTVRRVDVRGRIRTVAGPGRGRSSGDGGPARGAPLFVSGVAALPGGGFLVSDEDHDRIRMVDPHGVITTVAGGGSSRANGVLATHARLGFPLDVEALPGGGFVFVDTGEDPDTEDTGAIVGGTIRRVGPDGRISIVAGTGEELDSDVELHGQPATSVQISPSDVAVTPDGGLLIADFFAGGVDRVAPDGTITLAASGTAEQPLRPSAIAATPDGGFLIADDGDDRIDSASARVRVLRVGPDGTMTAIAGTGRFLSNTPTGFEHRGDGGAALAADLHYVSDIASMPDGGVLIAEGSFAKDRVDVGALVRYVAPAAPGVLAATLDRDHDRVIDRRGRAAVNVVATLPATAMLGIDGRVTRTRVGAGTTRVPIPEPGAGKRPHAVTLVADDGAGRRAEDRLQLYPPGWLPDEAGRLVAAGIAPAVLGSGVAGVSHCRRFGASRVDCVVHGSAKHCHVVASVSLVGGRLRWGTYACGMRAHPRYRRRPRALQRPDWTCEKADTACPPAWFGKLDEAALVPSS